VKPLAERGAEDKDPLDSNQAIPSLLCRPEGKRELSWLFPELELTHFERMAGLSYPLAGGFSYASFLPTSIWKGLLKVEDRLPAALYRFIGFRLLAVLERKA